MIDSLVKAVIDYEWYDYSYDMEVIYSMLEIKEKHWGKDTHYLGADFTKKRIQVVMRYYNKYKESYDIYEEDRYRKLFLTRYARLLPRLWD